MALQNYFTYFELSQFLGWAKSKDHFGKKKGSGYSAGPGQIVPRGYSTGPGQIVPRLFSQTRLNSYNALIGYLTGPTIFMLKYLRYFYLFSFI